MREIELGLRHPLTRDQSNDAIDGSTVDTTNSSTNANLSRSPSLVRSFANVAWGLSKAVTLGGDLFPSLWRNSRDAFCKTGDERNCNPLRGRMLPLILFGGGESFTVYLGATAAMSPLATIACWAIISAGTALCDKGVTGVSEPGVSLCGDRCVEVVGSRESMSPGC